MKLYDTLTSKDQALTQKTVNIYSCGPTVYNHIHLGNARPIILMDILNRYLRSEGYQPNWVQNITDIDDKIINQALKTKKTEKMVAQKYLQSYLHDMKALNIKLPQKMPLISDYLPQMINYIQKLIASGNAYERNGNVFFDVHKNRKIYGQLSKQNLDKLQSTEAKDKKSPLDFALWKQTTIGQNWTSPWGRGRPGWHTECVVLVDSHFPNQTLDIHAGGVDLQFPHHENERAQYFAATGKELAKTWLHNGQLTFNHQKMSKSLGNTVLVKDFLAQYEPDLLRWIFMTANYRQPINFSDDLLKQGLKFFQKLNNLRKKIIHQAQINPELKTKLHATKKPSAETIVQFRHVMNDNLNTAAVLSLLEALITKVNQNLTVDPQLTAKTYFDLKHLLKILGFRNHLKTQLTVADTKTYQRWLEALEKQDFVEADKYRQTLKRKDLV